MTPWTNVCPTRLGRTPRTPCHRQRLGDEAYVPSRCPAGQASPETTMTIARRADRLQRRHRWAGLPLAVLYKFVDDQGSYLAALLTYYGFLSLFPLLLLAVTVLGFVLHGNPHLQHQLLNS